jgi:hypothetical protein
LPSLLYTAYTESVPAGSAVVAQVALPDASAEVLQPVMLVPSGDWNATDPVGVPLPGELDTTVAVQLTDAG